MIYKNGTLYLENNIVEKGWIRIENGLISEIGNSNPPKNAIDLKGNIIIPGFIDQHTHGGYGYRMMESDRNNFHKYIKDVTKEGVTSVYLATVTHKVNYIVESYDKVTFDTGEGADFLGIHLEGPFIEREKKGAHKEEYIVKSEISTIRNLVSKAKGLIKLITISAEKLDDEIIEYLIDNDIKINIGHSNATYELMSHMHKKGSNCITHMYNAMSGHNHRRPGIVTYALDSNIYAEIICDGIHVHKDVVNMTYKVKGADQLILISDSTSCKGLEDGEYSLGELTIYKTGNKITLKNGTLAGSSLSMIDAFKNVIDYTGCSIEEAVKMSSMNAAKHMGIYDSKGSISVGKDADLLVLDKEFKIQKTICKGEVVYEV